MHGQTSRVANKLWGELAKRGERDRERIGQLPYMHSKAYCNAHKCVCDWNSPLCSKPCIGSSLCFHALVAFSLDFQPFRLQPFLTAQFLTTAYGHCLCSAVA